MRKQFKVLLALLLALTLVVSLLPTAAAAVRLHSPEGAPETEETTATPAPNGMRVQTPYGLKLGSGRTETRGETKDLPAYYNSADLGLVTSVKNQTQYGQYGTCWAFGTLSPIETYMIKNGMQVGDSGAAATLDLDLSEYHLSYFTYSNSYDEHGLTNGDSSILDESHLNVGGDGYKATLTLMRWEGVASEEEADLAYSECSLNSAIDPKYAYAYDVAHVTSVDWIDPEDAALVKQYLMEFGSAFIGYYYSASYQGTGGAYCYISTSSSNDYGPNHGVTLVGWDDNYSKSNFTGLSKPNNNGAWIVKNSWGNSSYTDHGYTYISYEDTSYLGHPIMFFTAEGLDVYDHLYQYDGTCFTGDAAKGWIPLTQNRSLVSNVFTAAGHETVEAFSICTLEENLGYTLQVYKNPSNLTGSSPDPTSGTLMSTQTGTIAHSGYHTIRIASPFKVEAGDKFSAVFTLDSQQSAATFQMVIPVDESQTEDYTENGSHLATLTHTHVSHPGTSFFRLRDNSTWSQLDNGASLRIKAYTTDAPFDLTVEAGPHGTAVLGDYTAQGYKVTAAPDSGYYASGYTITAGSAAVIQNGNVFYVNPTETTAIRIDFAQQTPFTLSYSANGQPYGSSVSGMTGDVVTLPATASAYEGYTFLGWATSPVPTAVTGKPLWLEPGAAYYPLGGNTTLYALYSFRQLAVPGQDGSYVKITSSAEFTDGNYLMVNEGSLHALDGSKASSSGMWAPINTAPNYVDVTISSDRIPDSATLRAADFSYDSGTRQFYSASGYPIGGYKNSYYFYVWGSNSSSAAQTVSFDASGNAVIRDDYYGNTLYYNNASTAYFAYQTSGGSPVQLYRKTEDTTTTYYSTLFNATPAVSWTVTFETNGGSAVPAQTVLNGQTAARPADPTKEGFTFAGWYQDAALTQAYDFSAPVTANLTLYAKWIETAVQTWIVSFNTDGGSAVASQTVEDGQTLTRPADPTKDGFVFAGWYQDAALTQAYDFSAPVTSSFTLYAKWTENAPVVNYTVTFMTNGAVTGTETVQANASLTLPATAESFEGWSFLGWTAAVTEETQTAPAYMAPGSAYTPTASVTLHALYTRSESGSGVGYQLLTEAPADWTGTYAITYGTDAAGLQLLKGAASTGWTNLSTAAYAVSAADAGVSVNGNLLANVAEDYLFAFEQQGSYYYLRNLAHDTYIGGYTTLYAMPASATYNAYKEWIPAISGGVAQLKNTYYNYYLNYSSYFCETRALPTAIYLWKQTAAGSSYFTTLIGEPAHVHTVAWFAGQAATCTGEGVRAYYYCADASCELYGRMYEDPELSVEITDAVLPALGHDFTVLVEELEPTCTETGIREYKCSRCDETDLVETAALGHLPGEAVQENYVEPTATAEGGYDTVVYCQRCNAELSREHTTLPATGPVEPIVLNSLRVFRNVSIGTDMLITFSILESNLTDYDSWYIQVTKDGLEGTETYLYGPEACSLANGTYAVDFTYITAKEMGVMYHAQVFAVKDGVPYCGPVREGSMKQYLASTLTSTDSSVSATLKTLAADMLNYGAAAQVFLNYDTEHLVNVELSETELTALHNYETTGEASATKTNTNTVPTGEPRLLYTSVAMTNRVELGLFVNLNKLSGWQDAESIEVQMKDHETQQVVAVLPTVLNANGTQMDATFPGVGAKNMRTEYDFVTLVDGVERGNIRTWSIEGYVNQLRNDNSSSDALKALANAVLIYGDSAQRYLDAQ